MNQITNLSRIVRTLVAASGLVLAVASAAPTPNVTDAAPPLLVSSTVQPEPVDFRADARLLVHTIPSITGVATRATTLLFVPRGRPPAGGWPIVAWAHGTTTPGQKTCAPSLTPNDLDGGLTRDGFKSDYAFQIGELVNAGYAVVAPDFEGLGAVASVPLPYYNAASLARSLIAGVRAAREAEPALSSRWAVFGHSDGGHAVLGVEAHLAEAPELTLVGIVASAPYASIQEHAARFKRIADTASDAQAAQTARVTEQFQVALMAVGLTAESNDFDPSTVMGVDLKQILPAFKAVCSVPSIAIIDNAIKAKGRAFAGLKTGWAETPRMREFLGANDPAVTPNFTLRTPTLIVQGTADPLVLEPLTGAFVAKLQSAGAPVAYKRYEGADHFSVIRRASTDVLTFLRDRFSR